MNEVMTHNEERSCTINDICRLCANLDDTMISIYADEGVDHMLENKIKTHLPFINISRNDLLPKRVCYHCASAVLVWNELYESSSDADLKLRSMFEASPYDQNECKSVTYADIDGIPVPVKDFIDDSIEYEEITDVNMFDKNEKSVKTLNDLDKTPGTSKTDSILSHGEKSSVPEDERLNPSLKSGMSNIIFDTVDDDDSVDHNMYLNAAGMDDDINGLMSCHRLDMSVADDCAVVVPKCEYLDPVNGCRMDVDQTDVGKDDTGSKGDDDDPLHDLRYEQEQREFQLQIHRLQRQRRLREPRHHCDGDGDDCDADSDVGATGATATAVADGSLKSRISGVAEDVRGDGESGVDRLLKCELRVVANGVGAVGRNATSVDGGDDDDDDDCRNHDRLHGGRGGCDDDDDEDHDEDEDEDEDEEEEDDDDSAVVDDDCDPMNVEVRQLYMSSLDEEAAGDDGQPSETMCEICATVFKTRYNLLRHFQKRHPEFKMYECDLCRISFPSINEFKEHLDQKHSKVQQTHAIDAKQVRFACDMCGNMYKNKASAMNHLLTHTAKKTVRCPHCEFTCYTKQQLGVHQTKHDKRFVCDICNKRFAQKSQLDVHVNAVHYNQRPFLCVLCNKSFKTKGSHDAHMIVHTDTRNYQCPHCDKKCRKRYDLTLHIRTHTGEKPFKCSVCGRGFVQMCDTRKHEMLHFKPGKRKNAFYPSPDAAGSAVDDE